MTTRTIPDVFYPESDGMPMADNALQFRWMSLLRWNADALLRHDRYVLVSADHLIYPVRGNPSIRIAPDVYIAFGTEKGDRGSYRVWEEGNVFPQVIFEVYSPSNTHAEMQLKREFCAQYGAEEFYIIYPEYPNDAEAWLRSGEEFVRVPEVNGFVSPRVGFRFVLEDGQLTVFGPDGREWKSPDVTLRELEDSESDRDSALTRAEKEHTRAEREREHAQYERTRADKERAHAEAESKRAEAECKRAEAERERAEAERERAEAERERAEAERERAENQRVRADSETARAESESTRAERLAEKLRQLGIDPNVD